MKASHSDESKDQNDIQLEKVQNIKNNQIRHFDWTKRWLKGDQYAHILHNIDLYCKTYGFEKFEYKCHPQSIYKNPINGSIYFVKGINVGSDFGFPRVSTRKKYRWKKMNFTTDLPKKKPFVTYVVASAMKANMMQNQSDLPDYRMHAVIPYKAKFQSKDQNIQQNNQNQYILCHVRQVQHKKPQIQQQLTLKSCFVGQYTDFYKLFLFLHNCKLDSHRLV